MAPQMTWSGLDWLQYLFGWTLVITASGGSAAVLIGVWRASSRPGGPSR